MSSRNSAKERMKLAELLSLGISVILVAGIVGFLVYQLLQDDDHYAQIEVLPQLQKVKERSGRFIVPVAIRNRGNQTLSEVAIRAIGAKGPPHDFTLDYVGGNSDETVYMIFSHDPRVEKLVFEALHYQID